jgi:hypothetical protein
MTISDAVVTGEIPLKEKQIFRSATYVGNSNT